MTLDERITEATEKFNTKQQERDNLTKQAEECLTEMTKLQGEWRVLVEMKDEEDGDDSPGPAVAVADEAKPAKADK